MMAVEPAEHRHGRFDERQRLVGAIQIPKQ